MSHFLVNLLKHIQRKYPNNASLFKTLWKNFLLTTSVVVGVFWLENTAIIKEAKDMALDYMMFWHSDFEPTLANGQKMQRMALFDIDEFSYRAWDSPLITPRDQLQGLIQMAIHRRAKVIAIDIGLSRTSDGYIKDNASQTLSPMDKQLAHYLQTLNENKGPNAPLIFLTRTYRQPLDKYGAIQESAFLETPSSFLDNFLPIEKNVFWSSTFFKVDEDRVIRRWQLAPLICQNGHLQVVPSMQLLVALAYLHTKNGQTQPAAQIIHDLKKQWNQWAKQFSCQEHQGKTLTELCQLRACPDWQITLPAKAHVNDTVHSVDLREGYETEKIIYRFAPADSPTAPKLSLIDVKPAQAILSKTLGLDNLTEQIVFIGVTHPDDRDYYPIPIRYKDVAGVYILANAVDTLLRFGQFQPQPIADKIKLSVLLILFITVVFTWFTIKVAFFLSIILLGVLIVWSFQALHYGVEIDFVLQLLAIQFLQFIYFWWRRWHELQKLVKSCRTTT